MILNSNVTYRVRKSAARTLHHCQGTSCAICGSDLQLMDGRMPIWKTWRRPAMSITAPASCWSARRRASPPRMWPHPSSTADAGSGPTEQQRHVDWCERQRDSIRRGARSVVRRGFSRNRPLSRKKPLEPFSNSSIKGHRGSVCLGPAVRRGFRILPSLNVLPTKIAGNRGHERAHFVQGTPPSPTNPECAKGLQEWRFFGSHRKQLRGAGFPDCRHF